MVLRGAADLPGTVSLSPEEADTFGSASHHVVLVVSFRPEPRQLTDARANYGA